MNTPQTSYTARYLSGLLGLAFLLSGPMLAILGLMFIQDTLLLGLVLLLGAVIVFLSGTGLYVLQPNQALVLIIFGRYRGTVQEPGFFLVNPFARMESRKVSLRVRNFTTNVLKINDAEGNPIDISAVVVWRVVDTALAIFNVDEFKNFVHVQSDTAVRHLGSQYSYDNFEEDQPSLRSSPEVVGACLHQALQDRLAAAGVQIVEARLNHLAYSTEIAEAMLRRQQAAAVVAARRTIVEGAVGVVEDAVNLLQERSVANFDSQSKAALISNLLVVLTSEQQTTPVINISAASPPAELQHAETSPTNPNVTNLLTDIVSDTVT